MIACTIPECENLVDDKRSKSKLCQQCRANIGAWARKPPGRFIQRCRNLRRYQARMTEVQTGDLNAKRRVSKSKTAGKKAGIVAKRQIRAGAAASSCRRDARATVH